MVIYWGVLFTAFHASATKVINMVTSCLETIPKLWIIMIVSALRAGDKLVEGFWIQTSTYDNFFSYRSKCRVNPNCVGRDECGDPN